MSMINDYDDSGNTENVYIDEEEEISTLEVDSSEFPEENTLNIDLAQENLPNTSSLSSTDLPPVHDFPDTSNLSALVEVEYKCKSCSARFSDLNAATEHAKVHLSQSSQPVASPSLRKVVPRAEQCQLQNATMRGGGVIIKEVQSLKRMVKKKKEAPASTTQKLFQESINEALEDFKEDNDEQTRVIYPCPECPVAFLEEHFYNEHWATHHAPETQILIEETSHGERGLNQRFGEPTKYAMSEVSIAGQLI